MSDSASAPDDARVTAGIERLQRDTDAATQALAGARAEIRALQQQLGDLRHRNGALEGQLEAMRERNARDDTPKAGAAATDSKRSRDAKQPHSKPSAVALRAPRKVKGSGSGPRSRS